jgi:outer membrane lipoprotein-sorting protein
MFRRALAVLSVLSVLFVSSVSSGSTALAQSAVSVDDLIARNLQAKGGAARMAAVRTMKQTAKMNSMGMDLDVTIYAKRPNLMRQELSGGGMNMVMAFDGTTAWGLNPMMGPSAVALSGQDAELAMEQADMDGPLVDYKAKGTTIEYVAVEPVGARQAHHLKITTKGGRVTHCYLDADTSLEIKLVTTTPMGAAEQELSDYRDVEGLKMPFKITSTVGGVPRVSIAITKIEINPAIDDAMFRMPK